MGLAHSSTFVYGAPPEMPSRKTTIATTTTSGLRGASELAGQARESGRRSIDQQRLQPLVEAGCHQEADRDQQGAEQGLAAFAGFHQPFAPARQGFARQEPDGDERHGSADAERDVIAYKRIIEAARLLTAANERVLADEAEALAEKVDPATRWDRQPGVSQPDQC
jgi:hypothetical protein